MNRTDGPSALIVAGGLAPRPERLRHWVSHYSLLVAADSGLEILQQAGLEPDLVTGDFDSVKRKALCAVPAERILENPDQESTDLEKAILVALARGAERIGLVCASGSRIDHTLNAVSLMVRYRDRADFRLHDDAGTGRLAGPPRAHVEGEPGQKVSLVPAPAASGLESDGLRYPLGGIDLVFGGKDGISNELVGRRAEIRCRSGSYLIYLQEQR